MRKTLWLATMLGPFALIAPTQTLQEKLGFAPEERLLIIHADDLGMCHSVNAATIHALEEGVVTSASVMMPGPWVAEIVAYAREHQEADLGIHLTLNSEWDGLRWSALSDRRGIRGLLDPLGYFWRMVEDTATHATAGEVKEELRAQVEHALRMGLRPTHLDTHVGTLFARRDYMEAGLDVADEFGIPMMVPDPNPTVLRRWGERKYLTPEFVEKTKARGIPMLAGLYSSTGFEDLESARRFYRQIIQNLPSGVSQIILHLGRESDELRAMTDSWRIRTAEYAFVIDPEAKKLIEEAGVKLVGWRAIQKAWRSR